MPDEEAVNELVEFFEEVKASKSLTRLFIETLGIEGRAALVADMTRYKLEHYPQMLEENHDDWCKKVAAPATMVEIMTTAGEAKIIEGYDPVNVAAQVEQRQSQCLGSDGNVWHSVNTEQRQGDRRMTDEERLQLKQQDDPQPKPTVNNHPIIQELVMKDLNDRLAVGIKRYGTGLQPHNGRDMLKDAYDEATDLVVYLRGCLYERDGA